MESRAPEEELVWDSDLVLLTVRGPTGNRLLRSGIGLAVGVWLSLTPLSGNSTELPTADCHRTNHPAVWQ